MKRISCLAIFLPVVALAGAEFRLQPQIGGTLTKNGFEKNQYSISYKAGKFDSAVLLDYDYSKLPAMKYRTLKSAYLRFRLAAVKNPGKCNISVGTVDLPWQGEKNLTWSTPLWPKNLFQKTEGYFPGKKVVWRGKSHSFGLAVQKTSVPVKISEKGVVAADVSELIRNKLYCGEDFQGIVLYFTSPQKKNWHNGHGTFAAAPELSLIFEGAAPDNSDEAIRKRTLKYFPSAHLPPVKKPYIFLLCVYGRTWQDIFWNNLHTFNTEGVYLRPRYEQRGILCLKASEMRSRRKSKEAFLRDFTNSTSGVAIDEWQSRSKNRRGDAQAKGMAGNAAETVDNAIAAIREYKKRDPRKMLGVYWRGEDSLRELAKDGLPDLVIPEIYTSFAKASQRKWEIKKISDVKHFKWAEEDGYYDRVIPLHGCVFAPESFPDNKKIWNRERFEHDIRFIQKNHPRFIGQGLYCATGGRSDKKIMDLMKVVKMADEVLHDVYVKPAPSVEIVHPVFEARLKRKVPHVRIRTSAAAQSTRKIIRYRYFIDNRLIAESAEPELLWDIRGEKNGHHLITVHAVDSGFFRSAAQIPVMITD